SCITPCRPPPYACLPRFIAALRMGKRRDCDENGRICASLRPGCDRTAGDRPGTATPCPAFGACNDTARRWACGRPHSSSMPRSGWASRSAPRSGFCSDAPDAGRPGGLVRNMQPEPLAEAEPPLALDPGGDTAPDPCRRKEEISLAGQGFLDHPPRQHAGPVLHVHHERRPGLALQPRGWRHMAEIVD